jgi:CBS domain-containing protein
MEIAGSVGAILAHKGSAVWSTAPNSMIFDAIQLMADKNVGALPVVENGQLVG